MLRVLREVGRHRLTMCAAAVLFVSVMVALTYCAVVSMLSTIERERERERERELFINTCDMGKLDVEKPL